MEFTKDMIFHIKYEQDKNVKKLNKQGKNGFLKIIRKHKFISSLCLMGITLLTIDIILINNFIILLRQL